MQQLSPTDLKSWLSDGNRPTPYLLDVREQWEQSICHIDGAQSIPMGTVPGRRDELPRDRDIVVICHHGGRSQQVAFFLEQAGFDHIHNLQGGIHQWALQVDSTMARY
jgi:rhodanese-related sulfurtransferase